MLNLCVLFLIFASSFASYHEQYRVPQSSTDKWESYTFNNKEYLIQNLPVNWENAKIICQGYHNGTLAIIDTIEKAEFLAEALSESHFSITSIWVGARRDSAEDPQGYRWGPGLGLRRTALDVLPSENDERLERHYPMWLNRTHVPVPEGGADCVALERVHHDTPVFLDLPCNLERGFVCERVATRTTAIQHVKTVRCRSALYHVYDGRLNWHQAAAYCVLKDLNLANIATIKCLKKLGMSMLKSRPSIESAWIGATGKLGHWSWVDTGDSIFNIPALGDTSPDFWPPMRDRSNVKQNGCLQLDRHETHSPVFLEARCERKMQFICYENRGLQTLSSKAPPSDDLYYYILVTQKYYWQHAYENCVKMNGTLASLDTHDVLIQLLLVMGENKDLPIEHIWVSGRLNMTKDTLSDNVNYIWYNPATSKRIPDPKYIGESEHQTEKLPWLDEEFSRDNSCLNLDRQDHLIGLLYGMPCDTAQYSICMIEKMTTITTTEPVNLSAIEI